MNRVWTEEELEILRQDRAAKVPVPVTAAKLGRPVPATYARARLIGTLVQPHQPWDETSVARLRALVSSDPPMTDKRIAEELGRTVTQIRWKMQDLGLIGVRDLSKLAKVTASEMSRPQPAKSGAQKPVPQRTILPARAAAPIKEAEAVHSGQLVQKAPAAPLDFRTALELALKRLEASLAVRLKNSVSEAEAGMVRAATDAIAEKRHIDLRLADLGKRIAAIGREQIAEAGRITQSECTETAAPAKRGTGDSAASGGKPEASSASPKRAAAKPAPKKIVGSAAPGASQAAAPRQMQSPPPASTPKIIVVETPVAVRSEAGASPEPAQVSGRGGWKSVRRDPARVMAQAKAKAKATSRADAVDLALAAQAAIDRFIRERGVTKTEANGISALVSRLQARGYIVVQDGGGWIIDQRHRVDGESALIAFAAARGISLEMAA